jgi:membrane fusion protein (multidrug efflux system)
MLSMMGGLRYPPLPVLGLGLLCVACAEPEAERAPTVANAPIAVVTAAASVGPMAIEIEAVGTTRANESVQVTSKASNVVTAIHFTDSQIVSRGDVLAEMDDAQAQAALAEAEASLTDSESQYNRTRDLVTRELLSQAELDTVEAQLKADRARVAAAQAGLEDTIVRAAFDGRTGFRQVSVGSFVSPGTPITTLDDTSIIKLDFTVSENFLFMLKPGLAVSASSAGLPNRAFTGKVTNIESRVDPVTRSITVRAEIPNPDDALRQGMFMTVELEGEPEAALLVPEGAIVPEQGRTYVFVVRDDVAERREVRIGKRRPGEVQVVDGLADGDRVIVEGTQNVRDGSVVEDVAGSSS